MDSKIENISKEFTGKNEYRGDPIKRFLNEIENQNSLMKERSVYEILKNTISVPFSLRQYSLSPKFPPAGLILIPPSPNPIVLDEAARPKNVIFLGNTKQHFPTL